MDILSINLMILIKNNLKIKIITQMELNKKIIKHVAFRQLFSSIIKMGKTPIKMAKVFKKKKKTWRLKR